MLYFTKEQVFWECAAGVVSESTDHDSDWFHGSKAENLDPELSTETVTSTTSLHRLLRIQDYKSRDSSVRESDELWSYKWKEHQLLELWWLITERYSECSLTYSKDRWSAIAGLCKILQENYKSEINAGIWSIGVSAGLLWHARNTCLRPFNDFFAPSWSWLNLDGPVGYAYSDQSYTGCIQKVFSLVQSHSFVAACTALDNSGGLHRFSTEKLILVCPTRWARVSNVKFADLQFRETSGHISATPAWKFFQTVTTGHSALELAREYRSMNLPSRTQLLYSNIDEENMTDGQRSQSMTEASRAIGWVVLDRDIEVNEPVLCALLLRRDLYGAIDTQQQVHECILLVACKEMVGVETKHEHSVYKRVGRGRVVEKGFSTDADAETIQIV